MLLNIVILFLAAFIPGIIVINNPPKKEVKIRYWLVFAGSYIFAITIVHLIPELFQSTQDNFTIALFILLGFFMQIALDYLTSGIEHGHGHHHAHTSVLGLMLGLVIHALMDGSILVHPSSTPPINDPGVNHSMGILIGIVLHKIPAAIVLCTVLIAAIKSKKRMILFLLIFAISSPAGLLISDYLSESNIFDHESFTILFAIVSGNFLHISTTIYFESSPQHSFDHKKLIFALSGALIAVGVEVFH